MIHNGKKLALVAFLSLTLAACSADTKETNVSGTPNFSAATANAAAKKEAQEAQAKAEAAQKAAQEAQARAEAAQKAAQATQNSGADTKALAEAQAKAEEAKKEAEAAQARAEAAKKEAEEAEAKAKKAQEEAEAEREKLEQAKKLSAEEAEKRAKADKIANNLVSSYFVKDSTSQTSQILNDPAKKAVLTTAIQAKSGKCNNQWRNCNRPENSQTGDVIFTESLSYAGYAVVRENYDAVNKQVVPVYSYIAVVTTPTTDKKVVTDATYKGTAVYSLKNQPSFTGYTDKGYNLELTLNVKDSVVNGIIARTTGKKDTLITLNDASVQVGNNNVVFEGTAVFDKKIGLNAEETGSYRGQFAGGNAEQVVGTFETDSTEKDKSVQGAFIGAK